MIRNLIFDLDGTLIDSLEGIRTAINKTLEVSNLDISFSYEEAKFLIGDGSETLIKRALGHLYGNNQKTKEVRNNYYQLYEEYQIGGAKLFKDLKDVIISLINNGLNCFVVTNKPDKLAQIITRHFYGNLFKEIRGIKEGDKVKPDPSLVLNLMNRYNLKSSETVYVGDSHVDVETAKNAQLKCALCTWGYELNYPKYIKEADYILENVDDLLKLCEK